MLLKYGSGTITTENLVDAGTATSGGAVVCELGTAGAVMVQVTGTYTAAGGLSAQITVDGSVWVTLGATSTFTRQSTGVATATITSAEQDIYLVAVTGARRFRVTALGAVTGTATVTIQPVELSLGGGGSAAGGGDASAANQTTQITAEQAIQATLGATTGAAVITDANGTIQQYVRGLIVESLLQVTAQQAIQTAVQIMDDWDESDRAKVNLIVGQAGISAGAGAVGATTPRVTLASDDPLVAAVTASIGYNDDHTITRTADTNVYAANDVIGAATGSTACIEFTSMGPSAGRIVITSVSLLINSTGIISGETSYILHLYSVTAPSALGDNAAFDVPSGDQASYLGSINLGTPVDLGSTLYIAQDGINKQIKLAGTSVFAYLVTVGTYTPTSGRVYTVKINAVSL